MPCDSKLISEQVLKKIHAYEQSSAGAARLRRKVILACTVVVAALLCAFTTVSLVKRFAKALPPVGNTAQSVLEQSGTPFAQKMICGGVRFTVEGAVWDDTACYIWIKLEADADASPKPLTELLAGFSFVVQPWSGPLEPEHTRPQNCGVAFLQGEGSQVLDTDANGARAQMMLTYLLKPQDKGHNTLNLLVGKMGGEVAYVALPLALNAPREQTVYEVDPAAAFVEIPANDAGKEETQRLAFTKITVQPFGAVLEGTAGPKALAAAAQKLEFSARIGQKDLAADVYPYYENGTGRLILRWRATVDPAAITDILCGKFEIPLG